MYDLRSKVGVVLQDVFLFHGSIYENLTLGTLFRFEKLKKVAQDIEVDEFIERLPGGYDFVVSEREVVFLLVSDNLLSFLRAYLSDPKILILDKPLLLYRPRK